MTTLDKELYRYAHQLHRQRNEAELKARVQNAGSYPLQQAWQQYLALWEFSRQMNLRPTQQQNKQKLTTWTRYYNRVQKLETWRITHGKTT